MLRGVIDNDTKIRDKICLNGLGVTKFKSVGVSMILKIMEVKQDYTVFNYEPPRLHKEIKSQDRNIVAGPGTNLAPKLF